MPNTILDVTFDGVTDVPSLEADSPVSFFTRFMGYYSVFEPNDANRLVANVGFEGSDWTVSTMRFGDASLSNLTRITDTDDGANRRIDWLSLGFNSDVDLTTTRVRQLTGWDGDKHDVQLGSGSTWSVALFAKVNIVKTGDGYVHSIVTYGKDTIVVNEAGAGAITTGDGNSRVATKGYVFSINTGDGNDIVNIGSSGAGLVRTGGGNDTIRLSEMNQDIGVVVQGEAGNDTVDLSGFTFGLTFSLDLAGRFQNVAAPGGADDLPGRGWVSVVEVENVIGTNAADTLTGRWDANRLDGKNGNDMLAGGGGNDTLKGGGGGDVFAFGADGGIDRVLDYVDGSDRLRIEDHAGGFAALSISKVGKDKHIVHDGGTIILVGDGGATLTASDFDFV